MPITAYSAAHDRACEKLMSANQLHRFPQTACHTLLTACQLEGIALERGPGHTPSLRLENSTIRNSTLLTAGEIYADRTSFENSRLSAAQLLKLRYSQLRHTFLRLQPGTGLDMFRNDVDDVNIEGKDSFSHLFNLHGLFTRCRFNALKVYDGNVSGIFYKCLWQAVLIRQSAFINSLFNHCILTKTLIRDCSLTHVTFSNCTTSGTPVILENCDIRNLKIRGMQKSDFIFINCRGIATL